MMYPILCNVRYETLHVILGQRALWKQVLLSVVFNWIVAPFFMVRVCYQGYMLPWLTCRSSRWPGLSSPTSRIFAVASSWWAWADASPWC
jgi:hypothetical protein